MKLRYVTITGADDSVSIDQMLELSDRYPFVEWGILVSKRQMGSFRFPSERWLAKLDEVLLANTDINISMHVCGKWVRQTLMGENIWDEIAGSLDSHAQRVQINTHAEPHASTVGMAKCLEALWAREIIFQWDGVNDHLAHAMASYGINTAALFDTSGGAGILPGSWPEPDRRLPCGYAGGLGPDNVVEQIRKIEDICGDRTVWIDMERRVRSEDDSRLDMNKVERVLKSVEALKVVIS